MGFNGGAVPSHTLILQQLIVHPRLKSVKDGGSNCQRWRLQLSKMEASNMEASNCQKFGHQPSIFSSLLGSLILATSLLFLL